ncbi:hypothetical protein BVG19_g492 [[Candida] boidinii]|nr:hypothetical protein BVG19_g492 [[Candida] boidinii]OWB48535.1 hypothetical protein B5S27_g70 [[Candida] boidinii]
MTDKETPVTLQEEKTEISHFENQDMIESQPNISEKKIKKSVSVILPEGDEEDHEQSQIEEQEHEQEQQQEQEQEQEHEQEHAQEQKSTKIKVSPTAIIRKESLKVSNPDEVEEQDQEQVGGEDNYENNDKENNLENSKTSVATAYSEDLIFTSLSNIFKSLISPKNSNFFNDKIEKDISYGDLISFYFYHSILVILYLFMSIYRLYDYTLNRIKLRFLNVAYNPQKTPSLINNDVNKLPKIPHRLSTIINYKPEQEENGGIEALLNNSSEIICWTISSGIPYLTIYEYHGLLKKHIPELRRSIYRNLTSYFGTSNVPTFKIKIPHLNLVYYGPSDENNGNTANNNNNNSKCDIEISLISNVDGRSTIVELTKVMSELNMKKELKTKDVTLKFVNHELEHLVGKESDLIILFQPYLNLQGYPPWHIRLSEMYWEPDNDDVSYAVYLRALQKFSTCKVNVGK